MVGSAPPASPPFSAARARAPAPGSDLSGRRAPGALGKAVAAEAGCPGNRRRLDCLMEVAAGRLDRPMLSYTALYGYITSGLYLNYFYYSDLLQF